MRGAGIGERKNNMSRQSDNTTKQVRIGSNLHRLLKITAAQEKETVRSLIEDVLWDLVRKLNKSKKYE